jgi:hypothetical protein
MELRIIDLLCAMLAAVLGWIFTVFQRRAEATTAKIESLQGELTSLLIDIPKIYATKNDVDRKMDEMLQFLRRIEDKIDGKVDKS